MTTRLPFITSLALFAILLLSTARHRSTSRHMAAERDSLFLSMRDDEVRRELLLTAGDTLPVGTLVTADGASLLLADLPLRFRYLYFYRADCPPCQALNEVWPTVTPEKLDSVAFIAFHPDTSYPPEIGTNRYAVRHGNSGTGFGIHRVPTLVVRLPDGRVAAASHGSVLKVAKLLDLYGIAPRTEVDSAISRFRDQLFAQGSP